jgi:hypothetical protein
MEQQRIVWGKCFIIKGDLFTGDVSTATRGVKWSRKVLDTSRPRTWGKIACWGHYNLDNILRGEYGNQTILMVKHQGEEDAYEQMKAYVQTHLGPELVTDRNPSV